MDSDARSRHEWEEPGCFEVASGVYRIPLPLPNDGLRAVNVYAISAADGLVLIDSGWALQSARARLDDALGSLGAGVGDVRRFLITHVHRDHYEQSMALRAEFGMPVALGERENPRWTTCSARFTRHCTRNWRGCAGTVRPLSPRSCGTTSPSARPTSRATS
jgi:glyoxylase-like metal-dependent hydrolase (beta-lactamase superfamily II)